MTSEFIHQFMAYNNVLRLVALGVFIYWLIFTPRPDVRRIGVFFGIGMFLLNALNLMLAVFILKVSLL